jgi:hypothetical protein
MRPFRPVLAAVLAAVFAAAAAAAAPDRWSREWPRTDFTTSAVPFSEILSGGPPKDGIPAIWDPAFIPAADESRLDPREPVLTLELAGAAPRAYPIRYLTWHEIVNDVVAGIPVAVTFCPLCNSAVVFDRRVQGEALTFGVSGKLRHSDMIMYDRETESWWQQAIGEGIVGRHTGAVLTQLPAWMEGWEAFRARNPDGLVMDQPAARRPYGENPYVRYDSSERPFLFSGEMPPHGIPATARVVRVGARAWPLERLRAAGEITEAGVTLSWRAGQASALDTARIAAGREVGDVRVRDGQGRDLPHDVMFAFAFHAFHPEGTWMLGE